VDSTDKLVAVSLLAVVLGGLIFAIGVVTNTYWASGIGLLLLCIGLLRGVIGGYPSRKREHH
jgi:hypothetical protein